MWPFDQNRQQMYQNYANAWDQGTYHQLPEQEVQQNYQQFVQNAPPEMVQQVHEQYYQQMPPQQRGNLMQGLLSGLMQRGFNPQQAGIETSLIFSHQTSPNILNSCTNSALKFVFSSAILRGRAL
jgi:hypothetical protein